MPLIGAPPWIRAAVFITSPAASPMSSPGFEPSTTIASPVLMPVRMLSLSQSSGRVQLFDRLRHRERRTNRALLVVLVCVGRAEERDDCVADELRDAASVALELAASLDVVRREPRADVLGVELLGRRGRADDVGEDGRDEPPLLDARLDGRRSVAVAIGLPHARQNFATSGFSWPQLIQNGMGRV